MCIRDRSISDIGKDCSETENEDHKIQQSNSTKKPGSSETEGLDLRSKYFCWKNNALYYKKETIPKHHTNYGKYLKLPL